MRGLVANLCGSLLLLLGAGSGLAACGQGTGLLVEVTSPLSVPAEIDRLEFRIEGAATGALIERSFDITTDWPHTLALQPGAMESGAVTITVTGRHSGDVVAQRVVMAAFESGREVRVLVVLSESPTDAGVDANVDTGVDAGPDSMVDGGPADGGCLSADECDDSVNCTLDTCEASVCLHRPDNTLCAAGTSCDVVDDCPPIACGAAEDCDDGNLCNGDEVCTDAMCVPGLPIDCDDSDDCTDDSCDTAGRGMCVQRTRDLDGDGFGDVACAEVGGVAATDCNDASPDIFPGAPESCNGADDDCNGACDEAFTCCRGEMGACPTTCGTTGSRVCGFSCSWGVCSPPAELCNGVDDDCNGLPDDIFACVLADSEACTTACGSTGSRSCDADCAWGACVAPTEACNGADDDCDGMVDEGFDCLSGSTTSCATTCGSTGSRTCDVSACTLGACVPPSEACNGVDDDCDTLIDETVECSVGAMETCTASCGTTGTRSCSALCTWDACTPPSEVCNGADDDCDGLIDEGFTCVPGSMGSCTASCGTTGGRTCNASCEWDPCVPPIEACNGLDDNCDGMCDETLTCCAGSAGTCSTSCGTTGSRTCSGACGWSACSPPPEVCNGVDDDCNAACDDGFACCAGSSGSCTSSCGSTGTRSCDAGCVWGACAAPGESCNGADDDCDAAIDEDFTCAFGGSQSCVTSCASTGTQSCDATCEWGTCAPPPEACNGVDDDCDASVDEGCGACSACAGATMVTGTGGRFSRTLGPGSHTGSCGGTGAEAVFSFTTTSPKDVFISTHGTAGVDTVVYVRSCSCAGTEVGCNDDADGRTTSMLQLTNLPADTYNVFVDSSGGAVDVTVDIYLSDPASESDRCGHPTFIPPGTLNISGSTCGFAADISPALSTSCNFIGSGDASDRLYYFYLPAPSTVTFDTCNAPTAYDTTLYVRGICNTESLANQPMCDDDGCAGPLTCTRGARSTTGGLLAAGLHYLVVDGFLGGTCDCGPFQVDITGI